MTVAVPQESQPHFDWPLADEAEALIRACLDRFCARHRWAAALAARMRDQTGTDFFEWVDHLVLGAEHETALRAAGFAVDDVETPPGFTAWHHPRAMLPRVLLSDAEDGPDPRVVAIRPELLADCAAALQVPWRPEGGPRARLRRLLLAEEDGRRLEAVERLAWRGFVVRDPPAGHAAAVLEAAECLRTRRRTGMEEPALVEAARSAVARAIGLVGVDVACQLFFEEERRYWEGRNRAARIQRRRQDALGLGWGNHDHHTFRCSRAHFVDLVALLLELGFAKRERYYAGAEAGWGAQILEQREAGIVVFADVDLLPEETSIDFSARRLPPAPVLRTVGLWCALHGDSLFAAGMHHLEARFDFDRLRDQLAAEGVGTMRPFSDFRFLRQAFTEGERWPVRPERLEALLAAGLITPVQAEGFRRDGAVGSHLENLQRRGGFKGFNQQSVSVIIAATDPRALQGTSH